MIPTYRDPADSTAPPNGLFQGWLATTNYAANWMAFEHRRSGASTTSPTAPRTLLMFATRILPGVQRQPDRLGLSRASLLAARSSAYASTAKFQVSPKQEDCDPALPQTVAGQRQLVGLCDGSVRPMVDPGVSPMTWLQLCDPADGQPLGNDF